MNTIYLFLFENFPLPLVLDYDYDDFLFLFMQIINIISLYLIVLFYLWFIGG